MMNETPAKVLSLLGASMLSLAFLFTVSITNASFDGAQTNIPSPFDPANVLAVLDVASNSYSHFLAANLITPAQQDFALAADNLAWLGSNAEDGAVAMLGLEGLNPSASEVASAQVQPKVAGAETSVPYQKYVDEGIGLFSLLGIK